MKPSTRDQVVGSLHKVKGKVREKVGEITNNPALKAKGKVENLAGKIEGKIGQFEKVLEK